MFDGLSSETTPAMIGAIQRLVVEQAVKKLGLRVGVLGISTEACLPLWVIWRRLEELGYRLPRPEPAKSAYHRGASPCAKLTNHRTKRRLVAEVSRD